MTYEEYYGDAYPAMLCAQQQLQSLISQYPQREPGDVKAIIYCCSRIKHPGSMIRKLESKELPSDGKTALTKVFDAIGLRIICAFTEDVYGIVNWLKSRPELEIVREKDYIAYPKPNGYRSYHLQLQLTEQQFPAEIQVRTIATDFWATLEHQLKYKKDIPHEELIRCELKRCADEIASVDLSMQTIRDIIRTSIEENKQEDLK